MNNISIKRNGATLLSVPITSGSLYKHEIMKEEYVKLQFNTTDILDLHLGDSITYNGQTFKLLEIDEPTKNSVGGYTYELIFKARWHEWANRVCFFSRDAGAESGWKMTGYPNTFLDVVVENVKSQFGYDVTYAIDKKIYDPQTNKGELRYCDFSSSTDIIGVLNTICDDSHWKCEWWVDNNVIYLGWRSEGTAVELTDGVHIKSVKKSQSQNQVDATRFYAFGSTRNITKYYRKFLRFTVEDNDSNNFAQQTATEAGYTAGIYDSKRRIKPEMFSTAQVSDRHTYYITSFSTDTAIPAITQDKLGVYNASFTKTTNKVASTVSVVGNGNIYSAYAYIAIKTKDGVVIAKSDKLAMGGAAPSPFKCRELDMSTFSGFSFAISKTEDYYFSVVYEINFVKDDPNDANTYLKYESTGTLLFNTVSQNKYATVPIAVTDKNGNTNNYEGIINPNNYNIDDERSSVIVFNGGIPAVGDTFTVGNILLYEVPVDYFTSYNKALIKGVSENCLLMPTGREYIDIRPNLTTDEIKETIVEFSDVYPRTTTAITDIKTEQRLGTDEEGNDTFLAYKICCSSFDFNDKYKISGVKLQITMQTGVLAGFTFEAEHSREYDDNGNESSWFELIRNESDYGLPVPNLSLKPSVGDVFILSGFDTNYINDALTSNAEEELYSELQSYINETKKDLNTYDCTMNMVALNSENIALNVGQSVKLVTEQYGEIDSRIRCVEVYLDGRNARYVVGKSASYSRYTSLEHKLKGVTYNSVTTNYTAPVVTSSTSSASTSNCLTKSNWKEYITTEELRNLIGDIDTSEADHAKTADKATEANHAATADEATHAASAAQLDDMSQFNNKFLRKDQDDETTHKLTAANVKVRNTFHVGEYSTGLMGSGAEIDGGGNAEMSSLSLRHFLEVPELRYNRVEVKVGDKWRACGAGIIESVNTTTETAKLKLEDGEIGAIAVGDICMGIYHSTTPTDNETADYDDGKGNRKFAGFFTAYFLITGVTSNENANDTFTYELRGTSTNWSKSFHPCEGMHFVVYGNVSNRDRQTSVYETRTYTRMLKDQNTWEISDGNVAMQYGDMTTLKALGINGVDGYSIYLKDIYFTGRYKQMRDSTTEIKQVNFIANYKAGDKVEYYDSVTYNGETWLCVNANGTTTTPSHDNKADWLCTAEKGQSLTAGGTWTSRKTYPAGSIVNFAEAVFIAKKDTTKPPYPLYQYKGGEYVTFSDGGYAIVEKVVNTDDWELMLDTGSVKDGKDGKDGASLEVQYSADGTSWHTTFANGDLYMRQKLGDGNWTPAMRIVGEAGINGENAPYQDFEFGVGTYDVQPTAWQDAPPAVAEGQYLWMRTRTVDADGNASAWVVRRLQGKNGANLTTVINYYKWSESGTTAPTSGYSENDIPAHTDGIAYLWNYEVCKNDSGVILSQTAAACIGYFPKGLSELLEYYLLNDGTTPSAPTLTADSKTIILGDWSATAQPTTNEKRYLWNVEVVKYSDDTYSIGTPHTAGVQGEQGDSVSNVGLYTGGYIPYLAICRLENKTYQCVNPNGSNNSPIGCYYTDHNGNRLTLSDGTYIITGETNSDYVVIAVDGADGVSGKNGADGIDGNNGDRIEFVYIRRPKDNTATPELIDEQKQTDDYLPKTKDGDQVTDNPSGVTTDYPYEYMATRRKTGGTGGTGGTWSKFSNLVLWAKYGEKGQDGDGVEYVFKLNTQESVPTLSEADWTDSKGVKHTKQDDDFVPQGWTDDPSGVTESNKYEYVAQRKKVADVWQSFSTPSLWAKYSVDGKSAIPYGNWTDGVLYPYLALVRMGKSTFQCINKSGTRTSPLSVFLAYDNTKMKYYNGGYVLVDDQNVDTDWMEIARDGEKGDTGKNGVDSDNREYLYKRFATKQTNIVLPASPQQDDYQDIANGWYDNPQGVDDTNNKFEYVITRIKDGKTGKWGAWSTPALWSNWGERGQDGDGVEYVFIVQKTEYPIPSIKDVDITSDEYQADDYLPVTADPTARQWQDDPIGVDEVNQFEFVAQRKKDGKTGKWQAFGKVSLWAKYSKDGYTPYVNESTQTWWVNGVDTGWDSKGDDGHSPFIGDGVQKDYLGKLTVKGYWYEYDPNKNGYYNTGIQAEGKNGTSVNIVASLNATNELPTTNNTKGDGYIIDGDLWIYTANTYTDETHYRGFENVGRIQGEQGDTYYYHTAWANEIGTTADKFKDFNVDNPLGTEYSYQGTCATLQEADPTDPTLYKWVYIKGASGDNSQDVQLSKNSLTIDCNSDGKPKTSASNYEITATMYSGREKVNDAVISKVNGSTSSTRTINGIRYDKTNTSIKLTYTSVRAISSTDFDIEVTSASLGVTITKTLSVIAVREGKEGIGTSGALLRPCGVYEEGREYVNNSNFRDVVIKTDADGYVDYYMVADGVAKTSTTWVASQWSIASQAEFIATSALLANQGHIDVLGAGELFVGDIDKTKGWVMTDGHIKHTKTGLELTEDGYLKDPDGLHIKVGDGITATYNKVEGSNFASGANGGYGSAVYQSLVTDYNGLTAERGSDKILYLYYDNTRGTADGTQRTKYYGASVSKQNGAIKLQPNTQYKLTLWIAAENIVDAGVRVYGSNSKEYSNIIASPIQTTSVKNYINGSDKWSRAEIILETKAYDYYFVSFYLTVPRTRTGNIAIKSYCITDDDYTLEEWVCADTETGIYKDLLAAGIDVFNKKVVLTAGQLETRNLEGQRTMWLDDMGNLTTKGIQSQLTQRITDLQSFANICIPMPSADYVNVDSDTPANWQYGDNKSTYESSYKIGNDDTDFIKVEAIAAMSDTTNVPTTEISSGNRTANFFASLDMRAAQGVIDFAYTPAKMANLADTSGDMLDVAFVCLVLPYYELKTTVKNNASTFDSEFVRTVSRQSGDAQFISMDDMTSLVGRRMTIKNSTTKVMYIRLSNTEKIVLEPLEYVTLEFGLENSATQYTIASNIAGYGTIKRTTYLPIYAWRIVDSSKGFELNRENLTNKLFGVDFKVIR